jgi:hypothetical protein
MRTTVVQYHSTYKIRRSCVYHARLVSLNGVITASSALRRLEASEEQ